MSRTRGQDAHRIQELGKARIAESEAFEARKEAARSASSSVGNLQTSFASSVDAQFKSDAAVGLLSAEEFKQKRKEDEKKRKRAARKLEKQAKKKSSVKAKKARLHTLSFADDQEDGDSNANDESETKPVVITKNPDVDTSFLPDRQRDLAEEVERERLRKQWIGEQNRVKKEQLEITYSYWDGSGHRRSTCVEKGFRIDQFLERCRRELAEEFAEMRAVAVDNLMYIKEDLIIPHHHTFYELQLTKARGKSGPLFHFDVHDDVRLNADARVEKDESHAGKVITRSWYDKNKHIFPASRWEVFDPNKTYGKYTIG